MRQPHRPPVSDALAELIARDEALDPAPFGGWAGEYLGPTRDRPRSTSTTLQPSDWSEPVSERAATEEQPEIPAAAPASDWSPPSGPALEGPTRKPLLDAVLAERAREGW